MRRRDGAKILDSALQRDLPLRELWADASAKQGSVRITRGATAAEGRVDDAHSHAERLLVGSFGSGFTDWRANCPVGGYRVDVAFTASKIAIEIDGLAFHCDASRFQNDRERQNAITTLGWQVLRFTWLDLTEYPQRALAVLRKAISAR